MSEIQGVQIGESRLLGKPKKVKYPVTKTKFVLEGDETQEQINKRLWKALSEVLVAQNVLAISEDGYWIVDGQKTDFKAVGEKGEPGVDGKTPLLRVSADGISLEISTDGGDTWLPFIVDFNKLRVLGYVDSIAMLPKNANIGDIYGVWNQEAQEGTGAYELYINTVKDWVEDYTITKVYDYDTELPSSATDGTAVLVPATDLTLDKEKVDGYKVYKFNLATNGWVLVLNTAEIYTNKEDIINYGDNVYALVQGATEGTYELYKRQTGWVYFGTNASISYKLEQDIQQGTETNILSGKAVKDAFNTLAEDVDERLDNLERNTLTLEFVATPTKVFYKDTVETITLKAILGDLVPSVMDIKIGTTKINSDNEMTAQYGQLLSNSQTTFTAHAEYYDAKFDKTLTLQSRYPVYTLFAVQGADITQLIGSAVKESARTSAVGTYNFVNNVADGAWPYLLVPSDVTSPSRFSMGGAPVAVQTSAVTIGGVSYTAFRLGSDAGYAVGVSLNIVAS